MKRIIYIVFFLLFFLKSHSQKSVADFTRLEAEVKIEPSQKEVSGKLLFSFDVVEPGDSIFIDAQKMEFSEVLLNEKEVRFRNDGKRLWILNNFVPAKNQKLQIQYTARPSQALYFIPVASKNGKSSVQTWTQGQGKYTSHWLPSFDDTCEKLEFDLKIVYPKGKTVVANGELLKTSAVNDSMLRWEYNMEHPMSSYLVAVAAGDFSKKEIKTSENLVLQNYYPTGQQERLEPTYRHTAKILEILERETGTAFPWQNYKQVPVQDFLYAGMENTGTTIFSDFFLVDSIGYNDRNYVNVNAHEMAHQWFGNYVTAASDEDHWLQEGFATYYSLLVEKEIFGEDYFYWKLFQSAEELKEQSDQAKGESLTAKGGSSLTYYQKGAWALHILKELIGKETFDRGIQTFLQKYRFSNASTSDFIAVMEEAGNRELDQFVKEWLEQSAFQGTQAFESLQKSAFIQRYLELAALKPLPLKDKKVALEKALSFPVNDYLGQEAVYQLSLENPSEVTELYKKAFSSGNLYTRQAISQSLQQIPQELKSRYEGLLEDESYLSREAAFYNLWMNFPEDRMKYLEKTEGMEGFLDKNIRTLWLALSLATPEVEQQKKREYFDELVDYTGSGNRFQTRQNAFGYLFQLNAFNEESLLNLIMATDHHNYGFRSYARQLLKTLEESGVLEPSQKNELEQKLKSR